MKKISLYIKTLLVAASLVALPLAASPASAIDVFKDGCASQNGGGNTSGNSGQTATGGQNSGGSSSGICGASQQDDFSKLMQNVINLLLLVLGMIAVIAIIIGGIRYTTSNGDPGQTKAAKDTILYAVIGLIVAILAYAIVSFVLNAFKK